MRRRSTLLLLAVPLLLAAACTPPASSRSASESRDVITQAQIGPDQAQTVFTLVERLRPHWLQKRGANSLNNEGDIVVYLDNARLGGPESLRQILAAQVESVRFLDAGRAQYRLGEGHTHGVILVTTRSR